MSFIIIYYKIDQIGNNWFSLNTSLNNPGNKGRKSMNKNRLVQFFFFFFFGRQSFFLIFSFHFSFFFRKINRKGIEQEPTQQ